MRRMTLALLVFAGACSGGGDQRTIAGSVYPLAWAAERITGEGWDVVDLTPPGAEAHDIELTLEQRAQIQDAEVVVYLGDIGFQPQVEQAVAEADGTIISLAEQLVVGGESEDLDPHVWLSPGSMRTATTLIADATDAPSQDVTILRRELERLEARYESALPLTECRYRTAVVTHEAFQYLIGRYGFSQFGLSGRSPEAEPSAERLAEARRLLEEGEAGAVFHDQTDEGRRVAETLAGDAGVPALRLHTLESRPVEGDYLTVMEENLESLRKGLGCP